MTSLVQQRFRSSNWRPTGNGLLRTAGLIAAGLILTSCTASKTAGPPSLANVLTVEGQNTESGAAATTTSGDENSTTNLATAAPSPAGAGQTIGVPKARPGSESLAPAIKNALLNEQKPTEPAQTAADQLANSPAEQPPKPKSLFERLAAARTSAEAAKTAKKTTAAETAETTDSKIDNEAEKIAAKPADAKPAPVKRQTTGFFANLFQNNGTTSSRAKTERSGVTLRRTSAGSRNRLRWNTSALPGVRNKKDIYGIDGVEEEHEFDEGIQLASVTNRARRGSHGLLLQRKDVKVGCFTPRLIRLLKQIERRFGRAPIITSGYRSRAYNRRIRGARNSMHIHCKAADIQVKGVSKMRLARYVRSIPGRGGVGTYCHTKSVHVDVGRKRDWNRRCRRRRARKS